MQVDQELEERARSLEAMETVHGSVQGLTNAGVDAALASGEASLNIKIAASHGLPKEDDEARLRRAQRRARLRQHALEDRQTTQVLQERAERMRVAKSTGKVPAQGLANADVQCTASHGLQAAALPIYTSQRRTDTGMFPKRSAAEKEKIKRRLREDLRNTSNLLPHHVPVISSPEAL